MLRLRTAKIRNDILRTRFNRAADAINKEMERISL